MPVFKKVCYNLANMSTQRTKKKPKKITKKPAGKAAAKHHRGAYPKLFGTDGMRGESNCFPIQPDIMLRVGQALGYLLREKQKLFQPESRNRRPIALIGKDTRLSGYMLEQALASGLNSMGIWVQLTGPLPTPGIGFLARNMRACAGIVISASHNTYPDNGIKIFDEQGFKISKQIEEEIERLVFSKKLNQFIAPSHQIGRSRRIDDAAGRYIVHVKNTFPLNQNLEGMRIVLDCAHGACYKAAPKIFEELGAELITLGRTPDGYNINKQAGAMCVKYMQEAVKKHKAHAGISLDGDGDRVVMADEKGELANGDHILGICALSLQKKGELKNLKIVSTHMSNQGLEDWLKTKNISLHRTEVGDRNVAAYMRKHNIILGGEASGHIIFLKQNTTGDGCVAALNVLAVMRTENKKLSLLKTSLKPWPQILKTVKLNNLSLYKQCKQKPVSHIAGYLSLEKKILKQLQKKGGRVYVRFSGTEPLIRVLVEGQNKQLAAKSAAQITDFLHKKFNGQDV